MVYPSTPILKCLYQTFIEYERLWLSNNEYFMGGEDYGASWNSKGLILKLNRQLLEAFQWYEKVIGIFLTSLTFF